MFSNDALVPGTDLNGMLMVRYVCPKAMKHGFIAQGLINHNIYDTVSGIMQLFSL